MFAKLEHYLSDKILQFLSQPTGALCAVFCARSRRYAHARYSPATSCWSRAIRRLSAIIKYLTQSTWSHAALYVGERPGDVAPDGEPNVLLEAEADTGVVTAPLSKYFALQHPDMPRRWASMTAKNHIVDYALAHIGKQYDTRQIVDLARYLFPYPPVPVWFRRRMLAIGSGDPTKAICSTLIAAAFASIHYPILPESVSINGKTYGVAPYVESEIEHIRKHGLYTPRDFDISPFFSIVKPTIVAGFDYHTVEWEPPDLAQSDLRTRPGKCYVTAGAMGCERPSAPTWT